MRPIKLRKALSNILLLLIFLGILYAYFGVGVKISPVLSESMKPSLNVGDAVVWVPSEYVRPHVGDVIVFDASDSMLPVENLVVHRWLGTDENGYLITKGDNNPDNDTFYITDKGIRGVQVFSLQTSVLRNKYTIPVAGTALVFVVFLSLMLWLTGDSKRNKGNENTEESGRGYSVPQGDYQIVRPFDNSGDVNQ